MLNQQQTGAFITELRKEKGYTQKQLADIIGVSDKAISRWETGRGLPDTSIMPNLCTALSISVSELLSGQRLSQEAYNGKAEEIMVDLMKQTEDYGQQKRRSRGGVIIGFVLLLALFVLCGISIPGGSIGNFIDIPSLLVVVLMIYITLFGAGYVKMFHRGFVFVLGRKRLDVEELEQQIPEMEYAFSLGIKASIIGGIFATVCSFVVILLYVQVWEVFEANIALALLATIYGLLIAMVLFIVKGRIHHMR